MLFKDCCANHGLCSNICCELLKHLLTFVHCWCVKWCFSFQKPAINFSHSFSVKLIECLMWHCQQDLAVLFTAGIALAALCCCLNVGLLIVISPLTDRTEWLAVGWGATTPSGRPPETVQGGPVFYLWPQVPLGVAAEAPHANPHWWKALLLPLLPLPCQPQGDDPQSHSAPPPQLSGSSTRATALITQPPTLALV